MYVVFKGVYFTKNGISHLEGGFTLRCLQRLSLPDLAQSVEHAAVNRSVVGSSPTGGVLAPWSSGYEPVALTN